MIQDELGIKDIDKATEEEQKIFLMKLINSTYSRFMSPSDVKKQKYLIFYKLFGMKKAIEIFGQNEITVQPITFVYYVFGKIFGEKIIKICEKVYDEAGIKKKDEFSQIVFVKNLLNDIFIEFPKKYRDEINLRFLIFLKLGEDPEKNLMRYLKSLLPGNDIETSYNIIESILFYISEAAPESLGDLMEKDLTDLIKEFGLDETSGSYVLSRLQKTVDTLIQKEEKKTSSVMKSKSLVKSIKDILNSHFESNVVNRMISQAMNSIGISDLDELPKSSRRQFLNQLMQDPAMSTKSFHRRLIIEDKLKTTMLRDK